MVAKRRKTGKRSNQKAVLNHSKWIAKDSTTGRFLTSASSLEELLEKTKSTKRRTIIRPVDHIFAGAAL
jgi:hypothetical protein